MHITTFTVNPLQVNCYVISDPVTNEAAIIDPGMFHDKECNEVATYVSRNNLHISHILLTHGHFDHIMGCQWAYETYGQMPELHSLDIPLQQHCEEQIQRFLHRMITSPQPTVGQSLADDDIVRIGTIELQVLHTPGHTDGGVCFYMPAENVLVSGDTIFQGSVGRTDLDTGNMQKLIQSIHTRILVLPDNTKILPGHGPSTTVALEKRTNPYLQ